MGIKVVNAVAEVQRGDDDGNAANNAEGSHGVAPLRKRYTRFGAAMIQSFYGDLYERTGYSKATEGWRYSCGPTSAPPKIKSL
jgi:hypothetical protein